MPRHARIACLIGLCVLAGLCRAEEQAPATQPAASPARPALDKMRQLRDHWDEDRPPGPRRGPMGNEPLSPDEREQALRLLEDVNPELGDKIKLWRDINPERVDQVLAGIQPRLRPLMALQQSDPQLYDLKVQDLRLETQTRRLASSVRHASAENAPALRQQLKTVVTQHFDLRQQIRQRELENLRRRIDDLQKQIETRRDARDELIDNRVTELTGHESQPQW
ncbi:MAG: hypothetical protein IT440_10290 [Phycisphaeraceae bacterium]|nr:hypothetical protein [Phycisphaeraceae bacterium]